MNFTPFFYEVSSHIKNDNDIELLRIMHNPECQEDFYSYYEEFLHCTYPHSLKCLYVLMNDVNKRYNVHSIFSQCFKKNNVEWLSLFLDTLYKKQQQFEKDSIEHHIIERNVFNMAMDMDYCNLVHSSPDILNLVFKYYDSNLFRINKLVSEIFPENMLEKLDLIDTLCLEYNVKFPIKEIFTNAFIFKQLNIIEYYFQKYQPHFSLNETTDLLNTVALHGDLTNFKYFVQHFLDFNDFNKEQTSLAFNSGLITNKTDILSYLKDNYNIDFYPQDKQLQIEFRKIRKTMWQDNNENTHDTLSLLQNINNLFDRYKWDKFKLIEEIQYFPEIKRLFDNVLLTNKIQEELPIKNSLGIKLKL